MTQRRVAFERIEREATVYDDQGNIPAQADAGKKKRADAELDGRMTIIALAAMSLAFGATALLLFVTGITVSLVVSTSAGFALVFVVTMIESIVFVALTITTYALRRWLVRR